MDFHSLERSTECSAFQNMCLLMVYQHYHIGQWQRQNDWVWDIKILRSIDYLNCVICMLFLTIVSNWWKSSYNDDKAS